MLRYFFLIVQFILLIIISAWIIQNSKPVSFTLNDIIITTSSSVVLILIISIVILFLILQKILFSMKQIRINYKNKRDNLKNIRGYNSFTEGMIALANKDFNKAIKESKKMQSYLKDRSLSLLLTSEVLKIEKKYDELKDVYEEMLKTKNMNLLGLRGLMEQNLRAQDFHHTLVYGEQLFGLNPKIDKLYETLLGVIGKTNNWPKLIQINEDALKYKIINKAQYSENKSIAYYEIAKIKRYSEINEAIDLISKALKLRKNFIPYSKLYLQLLIENNQLNIAKKYLKKIWQNSPNLILKEEIKHLADSLKISFYELSLLITKGINDQFESRILLSESSIEEEKWENAKNYLKPLLEHKPFKLVCLLMAKIEEGDSNDPQKVNSWISRSNFGKLNKVWICRITHQSQLEWSSLSNGGHFNSLDWKYPSNNIKNLSSEFESELIEYINK